MLFIILMTKCLIQQKRSTNTKPLGSWAPQGRRLGDERLEVLIVLVALSELPRGGSN